MLPQGTEITYQGTSELFIRRMGFISNALPDLFKQVSGVGLQASFRGVKKVRIIEKMEHGMDLAHYDPLKDQISIYPMAWQSGSRLDIPFYMGCGLRHWLKNVRPEQRILWIRKAVKAEPTLVNRVLRWFNGERPYDQILSLIGPSDERLLASAITGILDQTKVNYRDLKSMDLRDFAGVAEFVNGKKPYSLKPLIQKYGGGQINVNSYEGAFASYVAHGGKVALTDSKASARLTDLFKRVSSP